MERGSDAATATARLCVLDKLVFAQHCQIRVLLATTPLLPLTLLAASIQEEQAKSTLPLISCSLSPAPPTVNQH